jgi:hypothetical protein
MMVQPNRQRLIAQRRRLRDANTNLMSQIMTVLEEDEKAVHAAVNGSGEDHDHEAERGAVPGDDAERRKSTG